MTALPLPSQPPPEGSDRSDAANPTPVSALKELVANLHREQHKIQNLLSSLGFALRSFNNLNQFLEIVPLMAARVADADGGALVLFKPDGRVQLEHLHCQDGHTCQDVRKALLQAIREPAFSAPAPSPGKDLSTGPLDFGRTNPLDTCLATHLGPDVRVWGTSMQIRGRERGRLFVFSRNRAYEWTLTRQKLVQLVADQAAVAIANNDLTAELRQKERLDRELAIASDIQFHLLPRQYPNIAGVDIAADCRTANRVGGDYYDFIPADYDRRPHGDDTQPSLVPWSIVIGDVMGKGVPAGLIMTLTRGMLRAEVLNRHSPARVLEHLNRVMFDDLDSSHRFVTLFYSEYDPLTRRLSFSNAAHNPPLWWQAATGTIQHLDTLGMLIGLDTDSDFDDAQVQLAPGDTVLYYTDGFTDAVNSNGDRFEESNLKSAFGNACCTRAGAQAILDTVFAAVRNFVGPNNDTDDDMTLVVMQVRAEDAPAGSNRENF
ncbi:serine phosphatase RsbU, regulator of sigma subunit [Rubidibacter lacunae KORDI 51-2]|uniref:Serine phosphatase RsbU, regulator of sigma subunit n=1 Tax=Rubidibacter lacunae KORDI 51-2 TaxID=582515 RepID=U5D7V9_9CHRO|nr:GAF domain-containing SpoIIE family protein phosphatase [Rubidibacter lacunae]ERN40703.1 serine phosphatase RsbU, regulator of sigma subunit [Rubidibacter lacunae KORDI 51-2]